MESWVPNGHERECEEKAPARTKDSQKKATDGEFLRKNAGLWRGCSKNWGAQVKKRGGPPPASPEERSDGRLMGKTKKTSENRKPHAYYKNHIRHRTQKHDQIFACRAPSLTPNYKKPSNSTAERKLHKQTSGAKS